MVKKRKSPPTKASPITQSIFDKLFNKTCNCLSDHVLKYACKKNNGIYRDKALNRQQRRQKSLDNLRNIIHKKSTSIPKTEYSIFKCLIDVYLNAFNTTFRNKDKSFYRDIAEDLLVSAKSSLTNISEFIKLTDHVEMLKCVSDKNIIVQRSIQNKPIDYLIPPGSFCNINFNHINYDVLSGLSVIKIKLSRLLIKPNTVVKIFFDGSINPPSNNEITIGCCVVVGNHKPVCVCGKMCVSSEYSSYLAEMLAFKLALDIGDILKANNIMYYTDCRDILRATSETTATPLPSSVSIVAKTIKKKLGNVKNVEWIPREANRAADRLADIAKQQQSPGLYMLNIVGLK